MDERGDEVSEFSILQRDLDIRFQVSANSRMLANVSIKGYDVYCCSAAPSAVNQ